MLCSFMTDLITVKVERCECLCETKRMRDSVKRYGCYSVLLESSGKMLCSFITDLIADKVECGECLYEAVRKLV
jgi:hypothetical protein